MILVDSSVWIGFFRGEMTEQIDRLVIGLTAGEIITGDLILTEVLQGFDRDRDYRTALRILSPLTAIAIGGVDIALEAAGHYRTLRARGVTVRTTIDTMIATRCIRNGLPLLHADRDFDAFRPLGLVVVET